MSETKLDLKSGHRERTGYPVKGKFSVTMQHGFKAPHVLTPNQTALPGSFYVSILAPPRRVCSAGSVTMDAFINCCPVWLF